MREACQTVGALSLTGSTLYSSCEPCPICHTVAAEIERIVYAAPKEWADLAYPDRLAELDLRL